MMMRYRLFSIELDICPPTNSGLKNTLIRKAVCFLTAICIGRRGGSRAEERSRKLLGRERQRQGSFGSAQTANELGPHARG
jgi:hypothetical protein